MFSGGYSSTINVNKHSIMYVAAFNNAVVNDVSVSLLSHDVMVILHETA